MRTTLLAASSLACLMAAHGGEKEYPALPATTDPLPHTPYLSKQDLEKNYQLLESTPFDDPSLAYRIVVPMSWSGARIETPVKESTRRLVPIGLYTPPDNAKTRIGAELGYLRMDLDINVRDWLGWYADVNGLRPKYFKNYPEAKMPSWDMLAEHTQDGVELNTRLSAFQWGPHIFLAACTCPADQYEQHKLGFARICDSFELKKPPEQMLVSKLASVTGQVGRRRYVMRYPDVWTAAAVGSPTEAVTAWQINLMQSVIEPPKEGAPASQEVLAIMFVKLIDRTVFKDLTPRAAVEGALKELRGLGYEPGAEQGLEKAELKGLLATAELHYLPARKDKQNGEAIIAVTTQDTSMLVVTSLRPALNRNPYAWMVGKRALEIMLNYSSVQGGASER